MDPSPASGNSGTDQADPDDQTAADDAPESDDHVSKPHLGHSGGVVRVISFGGGGFDTTMQLGVIHALLVIQGRPPDAVVGLSAGAINSVLLAEVLQAGEELEDRPTPTAVSERHRLRMQARVARFRKFLDRLFRAPQELVDGLLPDAYQVDARRPLQTVQSPVFVQRERERRDEAVANRAGLVRLYNHLLGLGVSLGTITRFVRRILGYRAAGEIRAFLPRVTVRVLEIVRMWMLMGVNLIPITRVLYRVGASALGGRRKERGTTAGAIIFKFRLLEAAIGFVTRGVGFLFAMFLWLIFTLGVLFFPWAVAEVSTLSPGWAYLAFAGAGLVLGLVAWPSVMPFDGSTMRKVAADVVKSVAVVTLLLVGWSLPFVFAGVIWLAGTGDLSWQGVRILFAAETPYLKALMVMGVALVVAMLVTAVLLLSRRAARPGARHAFSRRLMRRVLDRYRIRRSLFSSYPLERLFSDLFDPEYWGSAPLEEAVEHALADRDRPWRPEPDRHPTRKLVRHYSDPEKRREPIHVGITAADLEEGRLTVISEEVPVVTALTAANAVVPFLPPRRICGTHYVDGANISNEPMQGVMDLLRERVEVEEKITAVHVYSVTPFPVSSPSLPPSPIDPPASETAGERLSLVDAAMRARRLQRFRNATLERRLTELFSMAMPEGNGRLKVAVEPGPGADGPPQERDILRAWVTPVEPDAPLDLNTRLFRAPKSESRRLVLETIADGCRAALEVMVRPSLGDPPRTLRCAKAVGRHLRARKGKAREGRAITEVIEEPLPGSDPELDAPGLAEICRHCALHREEEGRARRERTLSFVTEWAEAGPAWPHEMEGQDEPGDTRYKAPLPAYREDATSALKELSSRMRSPGSGREGAEGDSGLYDISSRRWPDPSNALGSYSSDGEGEGRPLRTLLFSGGVFRGVFQMGVVAALTELRLKPDLIAGASVGSITAAMTAGLFSKPEEQRAELLGRLSAAYLAVDRIVLTDRFADFIRNLTVRAADARFSLNQGDRVFRRFDAWGVRRFDADTRLVLAGLERLFYMSPFEIVKLVEAIRHRRRSRVSALLREYAQEWLDRMDAGDEVLGADPLGRLIEEYVVSCVDRAVWSHPDGPSFDDLREQFGIHFLATTTNLTEGRLEVLGMEPRLPREPGAPSLVEGLLASSAFPGVFRPRDSHEVFPGTAQRCQYIDGGVIDNLPLDAVAEFLVAASWEKEQAGRAGGAPSKEEPPPLIRRRPKTKDGIHVPHLVFSASLEVSMEPASGHELAELSWPELMRRTRQLGYNRKLDKYARTQRLLRAIDAKFREKSEEAGDGHEVAREMEPLDLDVVVIKPRWLCGTFGFHPMTGFRRDRQARSIAHGCASTLVEFGRRKAAESGTLWGADRDRIPDGVGSLADAFRKRKHHKKGAPGHCWLRPGRLCPFSQQALEGTDLPENTRREVHRIHEVCHEPKSHGR